MFGAPMSNSKVTAARMANEARDRGENRGLRTYPPQRSVELLGGRQIVGYDHAAEIRSSTGGVEYAGTWEECKGQARTRGILPSHLS